MAKRTNTDWTGISQQVDAWFLTAYNQALANDSFTTIKHGSPEHQAWCKHFQQLGWKPACLDFTQCTMPSQWPKAEANG